MLSPFTKAISVANFCTLSKRRCEPLSLTSPPDRAAVAQAELSANELGDNKSPGGAVLFPVYRKPNLYYQAAKETVGFSAGSPRDAERLIEENATARVYR